MLQYRSRRPKLETADARQQQQLLPAGGGENHRENFGQTTTTTMLLTPKKSQLGCGGGGEGESIFPKNHTTTTATSLAPRVHFQSGNNCSPFPRDKRSLFSTLFLGGSSGCSLSFPTTITIGAIGEKRGRSLLSSFSSPVTIARASHLANSPPPPKHESRSYYL